eukprot:jgi/Mesvir1/15356/Mv06559-RA.1
MSSFLSWDTENPPTDTEQRRSSLHVTQPAGGTGHMETNLTLNAPDFRPSTARSEAKQRELSGQVDWLGGRGTRGDSSNAYASGSDQNCGNVLTDRRTTRVLQAPGGASQIVFGDSSAPAPVQRPVSSQRARDFGGINLFGDQPKLPEPAETKAVPCQISNVSHNSWATGHQVEYTPDKSSTRVMKQPGGGSTLVIGDDTMGAPNVPELDPLANARKGNKKTNKNESIEGDILRPSPGVVEQASPSVVEKGSAKEAKINSIRGCDIFSADTGPKRGVIGGVRKPPGGGSSIMLG